MGWLGTSLPALNPSTEGKAPVIHRGGGRRASSFDIIVDMKPTSFLRKRERRSAPRGRLSLRP